MLVCNIGILPGTELARTESIGACCRILPDQRNPNKRIWIPRWHFWFDTNVCKETLMSRKKYRKNDTHQNLGWQLTSISTHWSQLWTCCRWLSSSPFSGLSANWSFHDLHSQQASVWGQSTAPLSSVSCGNTQSDLEKFLLPENPPDSASNHPDRCRSSWRGFQLRPAKWWGQDCGWHRELIARRGGLFQLESEKRKEHDNFELFISSHENYRLFHLFTRKRASLGKS